MLKIDEAGLGLAELSLAKWQNQMLAVDDDMLDRLAQPEQAATLHKVAAWNHGREALALIYLVHLGEVELKPLARPMRKQRRLRKAGFDPNQPRDETGMWADESDAGNKPEAGSVTSSQDVEIPQVTIRPSSPLKPSGANASELFDDGVFHTELDPEGKPLLPQSQQIGLLNYHGTDQLPADAVPYEAGDGTAFYAPPEADFKQVYAFGETLSVLPAGTDGPGIGMAALPKGLFDFQRKNHILYRKYANASNYGVGVLMNGAGYSLNSTLQIAGKYARNFSVNANDDTQRPWWIKGWNDAESGRWK